MLSFSWQKDHQRMKWDVALKVCVKMPYEEKLWKRGCVRFVMVGESKNYTKSKTIKSKLIEESYEKKTLCKCHN